MILTWLPKKASTAFQQGSSAIMRVSLVSLFAATTQAFKSSFINLGGVRHHVRDTGESDGPLALFFHGFAGSAASFEDVAPLLAAQNCRCIAVDRVAFGLTARPAPASLPAPPKLLLGGGFTMLLRERPFHVSCCHDLSQ